MTIAAGSTIGFTADTSVSHPGTLQFYMAKVPSGQTASTWDGDGAVWFKILSQGPNIAPSGLTWPSQGTKQVTAKIPECIAPGDYLLRVEHIALHRYARPRAIGYSRYIDEQSMLILPCSASSAGGAQFYISWVPIYHMMRVAVNLW